MSGPVNGVSSSALDAVYEIRIPMIVDVSNGLVYAQFSVSAPTLYGPVLSLDRQYQAYIGGGVGSHGSGRVGFTGTMDLSGSGYPIFEPGTAGGTYHIVGLTVSRGSDGFTYSEDDLQSRGFSTSFVVTNANLLGVRHAAADGEVRLNGTMTGENYFVGSGATSVLLGGNVGDYSLSRVQPSGYEGATADQVGAFLLTATNGSGAYAIEQTIGSVQFQNGQVLAIKDLSTYVSGTAALATGGAANDLLLQDAATPHQLFVGGGGRDDLFLTGNVQDYTLRRFEASTPDQGASGVDGQRYSGLELVARNGSGSLLVDSSVETVHFRNGQYLSFGDIASYVEARGEILDHVGIVPAGIAGGDMFFTEQADARILLNGMADDYALSRDQAGNFVLADTREGDTATVLRIGQDVDSVQFADGQFLALNDLPFYIEGNASFGGTSKSDLLFALGSGDQYLVGLGGVDDAYLVGNARDYTLALASLEASAKHPALDGYVLLANDGSRGVYIDQSVEVVHFENGQYLSYLDLGYYVSGNH